MSFAEKFGAKKSGDGILAKIIRERSIIYHLAPVQKGERVYIILQVDPPKHEAFLKDYQSAYEAKGNLELTDYGTVLHSGYGDPSPQLKKELREKYGLYEDQ